MKSSFHHQLAQLISVAYQFGDSSSTQKINSLRSLQKLQWKNTIELNQYHEVLMFTMAHPETPVIRQIAGKELKRIAAFIQKNKSTRIALQDSGLPFTMMVTRYSHDLLVWLNTLKECRISIETFDNEGERLNTLLRMTLPALERDETSAGLANEDLLHALHVKSKDVFSFLLNQFSTLNASPYIKDHLWESLKLWVKIEPRNIQFSKSFNSVSVHAVFYQDEILKKFDHENLIAKALPSPCKTGVEERNELTGVIKKSLVLTLRETDPSTFMHEESLRYFELERGISIAIYGMKGERQLPLQSYIGYTLFKNGLPAAYGGSWVFGKLAMFGLNIFEAFRGGESGYMMCQLLRVYHQVFGVQKFEVEPYQFGLDNPDGIKSGAYWFYYRYGFRSEHKELILLAEKEFNKIKTKKGYRSSATTLLKFTNSNLALTIERTTQLKLIDLTSKITSMIRKEFKGDRSLAIDTCTTLFKNHLDIALYFNEGERDAFIDFALLSHAFQIKEDKQLKLISTLIQLKSANPYEYNEILISLLDEL